MGSIWFSKKSFLYFGGAAIILIGGLIVVMAPYHYINFSVTQADQRTFEMYNQVNYYPQLEISVSLRPGNQTDIFIDLSIMDNSTLETTPVNLTLTEENQKIGPDNIILYEHSLVIDLSAGNYTVTVDRVLGATLIDLGLNQISDSRLFIIIGGSLNIIGIIMIIGGYCVPGTFLPSDSDTIISWGYEEEEPQDTTQ
ncbi:MAG: hypothetical protein OEV85_09270 [Candidatus Thorarchaeota archaeon]|nr:hypothetical protein [Candidatus Thorarchaeota archaeon]